MVIARDIVVDLAFLTSIIGSLVLELTCRRFGVQKNSN